MTITPPSKRLTVHRSQRRRRAVKAEPKAPITIIQACQDPKVFGAWFKDEATWAAWFAFLKVMFGLSLGTDVVATIALEFVRCVTRIKAALRPQQERIFP